MKFKCALCFDSGIIKDYHNTEVGELTETEHFCVCGQYKSGIKNIDEAIKNLRVKDAAK